MSFKVIKDQSATLLKALQDMASKRVLIGVPASEAARQDDAVIGNAQLAYIHENGSAAANIPARPFLVPGVKKAGDKAAAILKKAAADVFDRKASIDKGLNAAGLVAQTSVKMTIRAGEGFAPLKPGTLAARRRKGAKGAKGDKPLIRTGQLLNSISYVVRSK